MLENVLAGAASVARTALLATFAAALPLVAANAQSSSLQGTWSGSGHVVFPSGERERARCRARFQRLRANTYAMNATCATASTRVQQTAEVVRVSPNRYRGEFFNPEFSITGAIRITVSGSRLNATLTGGGGSAEFSLRR